MNDNAKVRFFIDKTGFFAETAVMLFVQACIFRVFGCWGIWQDRVNLIMLLLLPVCCCVLMAVCILLFGKKGFFVSIIPVLLGVVFFVYRALDYTDWVQTVVCIMFCLVTAVVYIGTVFGWIRTKWILPPLFAIPFLCHIFLVDIPALNNAEQPVSFLDGMKEISILCILAAMFCVGMALKKRAQKAAAEAKAEPAETEPAPAAAPQPAPAPTAAAPQPAPAEEKPEKKEEPAPAEAAPQIPEEPYTPMLTLEPEPWEPEPAAQENPNGSKDE